jgi:hypothetical protein
MEKPFVSYLYRFNRAILYIMLIGMIVTMTIIPYTATYSKYALRLSSNPISVTAKTVWAGDHVMPPLDMIFSLTTLYLSGSSKIHGDTGTNTTAPDSVYFEWSTGIDGNLLVGPEADPAKVVGGARPDPTDNVSGFIYNLSAQREYPLPKFPEFPVLPYKGELTAAWDPPGPYVINESGAYDSITVENLLTVEIGDEDILIVVNDLSITGSGQLVVNKNGSGRLILYVAESLEITGGAKINDNGDYNNVVIYYSGSKELVYENNSKLYGSIYVSRAGIHIGGSWGITGHIISGGNYVKVTGNSRAHVRAIYAPNASLFLEGSGEISGIAVAKNITLTGNSHIYYSSTIDTRFFEEQIWSQ